MYMIGVYPLHYKTFKGCNVFKRAISAPLVAAVKQFPVTVLTGPRQSGKTTLLRLLFPDKLYISLESPDHLLSALDDPRAFLARAHRAGMIIDEVQRCPALFSYLQEEVDLRGRPGLFVLSGSQNFLLANKISQSLAGRAAILELMPLSYSEFASGELPAPSVWQYLFQGSYPRPYHEHLDTRLWMQSYLRTYVERDVRDVLNVRNLVTFQRFIKLCAGRHGQLLNLSSLAIDAGISQTTASDWLSLLESSYLVFRLQPYHVNFNKRLVKTPKLYFYDTGLVCHLLDIDSSDHLSIHGMRGAIFEGFVLAECRKYFYHQARVPAVYFWRDQQGDEVDCLIERGTELHAIEVKSSQTLQRSLLKGIERWQVIAGESHRSSLVYAGEDTCSLKGISVVSWRAIDELIQEGGLKQTGSE